MDEHLRDLSRSEEYDDLEADPAVMDAIARKIARIGMTAPAIFFIEMNRPLSFIGSQLMIFLEPFIMAFFDTRKYRQFALLMEDRKNIDKFLDLIDKYDYEYKQEEKIQRKDKKRSRRGLKWLKSRKKTSEE